MSSIPLYKAFIEVGASEESATSAAEDVIQVSQLPQLATKADVARLEQATKADIARLEQATKADIAGLSSDIARLEQATKADIARLEQSTKADIERLEQVTKADIARLEQATKADSTSLGDKFTAAMAEQEARLIKWMVGTGLLYTAIVIAGVSLLV